jgi:predicted DNA binding CopG/RHH family protein
MGGVTMTAKKTDAELAEHYNETGDLSDFEGSEPFVVRRSVTISVRFSADEIEALRRQAEAAGIKVTAFIRSAALEAERPLDRAAIASLAAGVEAQVH